VLIGVGVCVAALLVVWLMSRSGTASEAWWRDMRDDSPVRFTVYGGTVICCVPRGRVEAMRLDSGAPLWDTPFRGAMGFHEAPAVSQRRVIAVTDGGYIYALAWESGKFVWAVETGDAVRCPPLVDRGVVYVGSDEGHFRALELVDGRERWRYEAGAAVTSGSVLAGGTLVFGTADGRVLGLGAADGRLRWLETVGLPVCARPAVVGNRVVVGTDEGTLLALDPTTGLAVARARMPDGGLIRADLVADGGVVYAATTSGWIAAYDAQTLRRVWARQVGDEVSAGPILSGDELLCAAGRARVIALAKQDGRVRHRWKCPWTVRGCLASAKDMVLAGTYGGGLFAFHLPSR